MRVAALYDVHGNLPALEAVLAEAEREEPDLILVGGDVAAGPFPRECLESLQELGERAVWIRGNADRELGDWPAAQLSDEQLAFLRGLPETVVLEIDELGPVLFCHGSPRSDEEIITAASPPERVRPMLAGLANPVVVCGHTHVQFDRRVDGTRLVNAGSVGMPYQAAPGHAFWCMLGPGVELRRSAYDAAAAAAAIEAGGMPGAADWAAEYVRAQHPAEEATRVFEEMAQGG